MWVNFAEQVNLHENEAKLREWVWAPRAHKLCPLSSNPFIELSGAPPLSNLHRAVARVKLVISILITAADRHLSFTPCVCMRWCLRRAPNQNSYPHRSTVGIWSAEWNFRLSSTCIIFWLLKKTRAWHFSTYISRNLEESAEADADAAVNKSDQRVHTAEWYDL